MVGIGTLLALLSVVHLVTWFRRHRFVQSRWFHRAVVAAGPLSVVALICGWVTTEVGRQPWVVYGVMRTSQAVTGAGVIPVGYATLVVVYVGLGFAVAWILRHLGRRPLDRGGQSPALPEVHGAR
jgi:cytochrome d ubiquinol oxidase subunit I